MVSRVPVEAVVAAVRPAGAHDVLTLSVPDDPSWSRARPGQLVVEPVDPAGGRVAARTHWLAGCRQDVLHGTTIELVVPAESEPRSSLRLLGPLGRGFALPLPPVPALLVGHGDDAVPLRWLAELLRVRGPAPDVMLCSVDPDGHLDPSSLRRQVRSLMLIGPDETEADVSRSLRSCDAAVVYAVGPAPWARQVARAAALEGRACRVAPFSPGPLTCGTGLCGACEPEGLRTRLRPCSEGPVVAAERLLGEGADRAPR